MIWWWVGFWEGGMKGAGMSIRGNVYWRKFILEGMATGIYSGQIVFESFKNDSDSFRNKVRRCKNDIWALKL